MAVLSKLLGMTSFQSAFMRTFVPSIATIFALQAAVGIPSILAKSERYYDISGSLTYISATALSLYLPTLRARAARLAAGEVSSKVPWPGLLDAFKSAGAGAGPALNWRQVLLSTAVSVWATRLGTYLYARIAEAGHDSRFDSIRGSPPKFAVAWTAQAVWITTCLLPVLAVNAVPSNILARIPLGPVDIIGLSIFAFGLAFEVTADRQKSAWVAAKKRKEHDEEFITHGLWGKSRHPNYFGESTLWTGIAITAAGVLTREPVLKAMGWTAPTAMARLATIGLCAASPAFVTMLVLKVSGVPMSEGKYDEKFGSNPKYQKWKKETPMFIPKLS